MHSTSPSPSPPRVRAEVQRDTNGNPRALALSHARERVILEPDLSWTRVDAFKWVTRGIIEQPQSFHVHPDGTVEINGEKISPLEPDAVARLEQEINKHHEAPTPSRPTPSGASPRKHAQGPPPDRVVFRVKLDHFGHLQVDCLAGEERTTTGLRGISSLAQNGLMLAPAQLHVDPMQRHIEIDGVRFECNEAGARQLETALNAHYAPKLKDPAETPVEIRDNAASPSGFDIRFLVMHAGARFEVKGHLDQEKLDLLQDQSRCNLLNPGVLIRVVPPYLLVRRRRPDGGEEHFPELPDLQYLRASAVELQQFLNHPLVRRGAGGGPQTTVGAEVPTAPERVAAWRVGRHPQSKLALWLDGVTSAGKVIEARAFTHHNLIEIQRAGWFQPHLDLTLSLDNRTLSVLNTQTGEDQRVVIEPSSSDEELAKASALLTAALRPAPAAKPPRAAPPKVDASVPELPTPGDPPQPAATGRAGTPLPAESRVQPAAPTRAPAPPPITSEAPPPPASSSDDMAGFPVAEPADTLDRIFRTLVADLARPLQDVRLSLPPAFHDRRFEILSFNDQPLDSVLELRSEVFAGFYLTHLHDGEALLVYANQGRHLEFGVHRCELQPAVSVEPGEYHGSALLGLAQDRDGNFVFLVTPEFRTWSAGREAAFHDAAARFLNPGEARRTAEDLTLIWPETWPDAPGPRPVPARSS